MRLNLWTQTGQDHLEETSVTEEEIEEAEAVEGAASVAETEEDFNYSNLLSSPKFFYFFVLSFWFRFGWKGKEWKEFYKKLLIINRCCIKTFINNLQLFMCMKISKKELLRINHGFGGNLRSDSSLDYALDKLESKKLGIYKKIAYLLRAILVDHPFSDGNKRTAAIFL